LSKVKTRDLDGVEYIEGQIDNIEITKNHTLVADSVEEKEAIVESDVDVSERVGTLVKQEEHMDAQAQRKQLELLVEQNLASGKKAFVFPEVVKADKYIEVFLN